MVEKQPTFRDRSEAGRHLADMVETSRLANPVLVALSNDGVPVAFEIAQRLGLPLDFLIIQHISAPGNPRQSIGMIVDGPQPHMIVDEGAARRFRPPPGYLDAERHHQLAEIDRRHRMYFGEDEPEDHDHKGRDVILVDDGSASVAAIQGAIKALRSMQVGSLRLALPFARADVVEVLAGHVDEVISLSNNAGARAAYLGSSATTDQEAVRLLRQVRKLGRMLH
jgi:putative phosphoribosyl transferase